MVFFKKGELKLLWPFYLKMFLGGIIGAIIAPVMILYFQNLGFSFFQISLLFALPMIATFIFEIPTGAIADIYGRKFSVILSLTLGGLLTFVVPFFKEISLLVILFFISAIISTLSSGADDAWVVDNLKHNKKSELVQSYYIKLMTFAGAGIFLGGIISSLVILFFGIKSIWYISGIGSLIIAMILGFFAKEDYFKKRKVKIKKSLSDTFKQSKKGLVYVWKHPVLFYFVLEVLLFSLASIFALAWQPYFKNLGLGLDKFGLIYSVIGLIAIFAPMLSIFVLKIFKSEKNSLIVSSLINGILLIILTSATSLTFALVTYLLIYPLSIAISPISSKFQQQFIPSKQRATINSLFSAISVPGAILSLLFGGFLMDKFGARIGFLVVGITSFISIILYYLMKPEKAKMHI